ncbi:putative Ig domain-containing protein [uncultured Shimia sp.]|uniref:putative Ig domain-containing protein n=1 Tax=uncultured Shimia sp. TaxID=573152 RepID=UPI002620DAB8|nr:putative Ig domain-containing protein [uncultured Shimia sp.]
MSCFTFAALLFLVVFVATPAQSQSPTRSQITLSDIIVGVERSLQLAPVAVNPLGTLPLSKESTSALSGYEFAVQGGALPEGLALTPNGVLSGRPSQTGTAQFDIVIRFQGRTVEILSYTLTVTNLSDAPNSVKAAEGVAIGLGLFPLIADFDGFSAADGATTRFDPTTLDEDGGIVVNTKLPNVNEGEFYEFRIVPIEPADGPFVFTTLDNNLPDGLVLSPDGVVSGATCDGRSNTKFFVGIDRLPDLYGEFEFSIKIDGSGNPNQCDAEVPIILPATIPAGFYDRSYEQFIAIENSADTFTFSVLSGVLPVGVTLVNESGRGKLAGFPQETGSFIFRVEATSTGGETLARDYNLVIIPVQGGISISPDALSEGQLNQSYSQQLSSSGGDGAYTYSLEDPSALPAGISFSSDGLFSGTPTEAGAFSLVANVIDGQGNTGTASYTLTITSPSVDLSITPSVLSDADYNVAYSQQLTASGGDGAYSFSLGSGVLPAGISLSNAGLLSGLAQEAGTFSFSVDVVDGQGNSGNQPYTLVVNSVSDLITITPSVLAQGTFGVFYELTLGATGGDGNYTPSLTGALPAGMTFDTSDGTFRGTPTQTGTFPVTVDVVDGQGNTGQKDYELEIVAISTLEITPATLSNATYNTLYNAQLAATGGNGSYSFSLSAGTLPNGVTMNGSGLISGTPTQAGDFSFVVAVSDTAGNTGERSYTLTVDRLTDLDIQPTSLTEGVFGVLYSQQVTASGGDGSYEFSVTAGVLPTGVQLTAGGLMSGTPTQTGNFPITVQVVDGQLNTGTRDYTLNIATTNGVIVITPDTLPEGTYSSAYSVTLDGTGGAAPYEFSLDVGPLPTGLTLVSDGTLSGTPTQTGSFPITVGVTDAQNNTSSKSYTLVVNTIDTISITPATVPDGTFGVAYNQQLSAAGGEGPYSFAVTLGALPNGVTLDSDGLISGTPVETGDFQFVVTATDAQNNTGIALYTLTIAPNTTLISIAPTTLPNGTYRVTYDQDLTASGGIGPYDFSISAGALPPGVSLSSSGTLLGSPLENGTFNFTVSVQDAQRNTGSRAYVLDVDPITTLDLEPPSLADGVNLTPYSQQLFANGGDGTYSFAVTSGALPDGLNLSAGGLISGTPTTSAVFPNIEITVTDTQLNTGVQTYSITIAANPQQIVIAPATLTDAQYGSFYSQPLSSSGGNAPYSYSQVGGTMPAGVSLVGSTISGVPTEAGSFSFRIRSEDNDPIPNSGEIVYTLTVARVTDLVISPATLPEGTYASAYSTQLTASGGDGTYGFALTAGALPAGLALETNGLLSGNPLETGTFPITVTTLDSEGNTGTRDYDLVINPVLDLITITPPSLPPATFGVFYELTLGATGGDGNYTPSLTGALPAGMTFDTSDGTFRGTPTQTGTFPVTVDVVDGQNNTGQIDYVLEVLAVSTLEIAPATLSNATFNAPYNAQLTATGGDGNYSFSSSSGALPDGMSLGTDGLLTGTPTQTGSFQFTVDVTDLQNNTGQRTYTLIVDILTNLGITPATLPNATYLTDYSQQLQGTGGVAPYSFEVQSGALPAGLTLTATGLIRGRASVTGRFDMTVGVTDAQGNTGSQAYTLVVDPISDLITITPESLPPATFGLFYELTLGATGGDGNYTPSLTGALPAGMTFDTSDGTFRGTPTQTGTFPVTVDVVDGQNNTGQKSYVLEVVAVDTLEITPTTLGDATFNVAYGQQLTATGGNGSYTFSVPTGVSPESIGLPEGITLSASGLLSGTPTEAGDFTFVANVVDTAGNTGQRAYTLTVARVTDLVISPATLPEGTYASAYSTQLTASGGDGTYGFALTAGALPAGLALETNGLLSGNPLETGTFPITVTTLDSEGNTGTRDYDLVVNPVLDLITITPAQVEDSVFGNTYFQQLTANGGEGPYTFSIESGALPDGLVLSSEGAISGTPQQVGTFSFRVFVVDGQGNTGSGDYVTNVLPGVGIIEITPSTLPAGLTSNPYEAQLSSSKGIAPYVYSTDAGSLPDGLTLEPSTGLISGVPQFPGTANFSVNVIDSQGNTGRINYGLVIDEGRPDPSTDPEVIELVEKTFSATREMIDNHRQSALRRLENLRTKFDCNALKEECNALGAWQIGRYVSSETGSFASYVLGVDYQVRSDLIVGLSFGYGQAKVDVGRFGSGLDVKGNTVAAYFTHTFGNDAYLEGLLGYGEFKYQTQRYLTNSGGYELGRRDGDSTFMSLRYTQAYKLASESILSVFAGYDAGQINLDSFTELNGTNQSLTFGSTSQFSQAFNIGVNFEKTWHQSWGLLNGWVEAKFAHEVIGGFSQRVFYKDTPEIQYVLTNDSSQRNRLTFSFGVETVQRNSTASIELFVSNVLESSIPSIGLAASYQLEF